MVWIHGGTFETGAGSQPMFEGTHMASKGKVIVVTVNYRLGPFGFMHLSPFGGGLASNAGLLDQIAALQWVQGNIAAFGGDPKRVTLFGESAGSMSIAALLAMPAAQGLFAGAIMQSGAAQTLKAQQGEEIGAAFLAELGIRPGWRYHTAGHTPGRANIEGSRGDGLQAVRQCDEYAVPARY